MIQMKCHPNTPSFHALMVEVPTICAVRIGMLWFQVSHELSKAVYLKMRSVLPSWMGANILLLKYICRYASTATLLIPMCTQNNSHSYLQFILCMSTRTSAQKHFQYFLLSPLFSGFLKLGISLHSSAISIALLASFLFNRRRWQKEAVPFSVGALRKEPSKLPINSSQKLSQAQQ